MAPKQEHTGAELSSPHQQASTKRLKLTSEDALTPRPEKRARRLRAQSDLAQNIQKLPQELQDDILDLVLAASLPSKPAQITIGREHNTFSTPLALRINRKTRAKFAELFYRQGQLLLIDTRGLPTEVLAKAIDDWFEIVDPRHHEYIVSVDFQCQDRSIRQYDSDDSDDSGGGYDDRYEMQGYNMDGVSMSMGEEYRGSSRVVGDGRLLDRALTARKKAVDLWPGVEGLPLWPCHVFGRRILCLNFKVDSSTAHRRSQMTSLCNAPFTADWAIVRSMRPRSKTQ